MYHSRLGIGWKEYLHEIKKSREDISRSITEGAKLTSDVISDQTREIIASNDALQREYKDRFSELEGTLNWGISTLENAIGDVETSIEDLRSDFHYGISLMVEQLRMQNRLLKGVVERLDDIYKAVTTPMRTRARELFQEGCNLLGRGLLDKALEFFHKAEEVYDVDFFTHFQVGKLYLYGKDEDDDVVDLGKAEKHLGIATRYGKAEIKQLPEMARYAGEALLHLSIARYAQYVEHKLAAREEFAKQKLLGALAAAKEAVYVYPNISESHYHLAKYSALLGDGKQVTESLTKAIVADRKYCIKADLDKDFNAVSDDVRNLFKALKEQAKVKAETKMTTIRAELSGREYLGEKEFEIRKRIDTLLEDIQHYMTQDSYFDYLDALSQLELVDKLIDISSRICFGEGETYSGINKAIESMIEDASSLLKQGKYQDCQQLLQDFRHASETTPLYVQAWVDRADSLLHLGRYEKSLYAYDGALGLIVGTWDSKQLASWWCKKGNTLAKLKSYEEALNAYDKAVEIDSGYRQALEYKADLLLQLGRTDQAVTTLDQILEAEPQNVWARQALEYKADLLLQLGYADQVVKTLDRILEVEPRNVWAWSNKGTALLYLARNEEVIGCFDRALEVDPNLRLTKVQKKFKFIRQRAAVEVKGGDLVLKEYERVLDSVHAALSKAVKACRKCNAVEENLKCLRIYQDANSKFDLADKELDSDDYLRIHIGRALAVEASDLIDKAEKMAHDEETYFKSRFQAMLKDAKIAAKEMAWGLIGAFLLGIGGCFTFAVTGGGFEGALGGLFWGAVFGAIAGRFIGVACELNRIKQGRRY